MLRGKLRLVPRSQARPVQGNQASLLSFLCYSGHLVMLLFSAPAVSRWAGQQGPHIPPCPQHQPENPDGSWGQPVDTTRFTHHSPSVIAPSASSPSSSFQESLLHSLTHTHTPQILHHKLVQKRVLAILKVWSRETSLLAAALISPSLLTPSWCLGGPSPPGEEDMPAGSHGLQATRLPGRPGCKSTWETTAGLPQPFFSL